MKRKSLLMSLMALFVMVNFAILSYGQAKDTANQKIPETVAILRGEALKVPMGQLLLKVSVNPTNVFVLDQNQKKVAVSVSMDSTGKYVVVKPRSFYTVGQSYTLYISKTIFFRNGKHPTKEVVQQFTIKETPALSVVGSMERLKEILLESNMYSRMNYGLENTIDAAATASAATAKGAADASPLPQVAAESAAKAAEAGADYSKTNLQVEGVDEADIVKTDGQYIYTISGRSMFVVKAVPSDRMEQVGSIVFDDKTFYPSELYVDSSINRLVVIGQATPQISYDKTNSKNRPYGMVQTTRAIVYDSSDRSALKKLREFDLEGGYLSSRKIGSKLYMVTNKRIETYRIENRDDASLLPSYRDTSKSDEYISVDCGVIRYFPETIQSNFLMIGVLDLNRNEKAASISTYLGSGNNIYMSESNLYVAVNRFDREETSLLDTAKSTGKQVARIWWPGNQSMNTLVYRFKVMEEGVDFAASGEVPGVILNQFSMDEYGETFRIATTKGEVWAAGEQQSKNNLYILNSDMKISGSLTDLAPGEKIYSVRFMGERAYIVTFKKVDPLFVIDLKDKTSPKVLGALKIPGYSDYLHPYDETHIIGFGKDTIEVPYKDSNGKVIGTNAYYLGMKVALFDVGDVANPKEISHEIIGDRGTWSPLLSDHKALMFSKEKKLMVFPVTEYKLRQGAKPVNDQNGNAYPEYGTFSYQGAYVYSIDTTSGFTLKGRITHLSDEDYKKAGEHNSDARKYINRALYIGDTLYTCSNQMLKANALKGLLELDTLTMK